MHKYFEKEVVDSFQAFLVDDAEFTEVEEYPILRKDMVPQELPERIMPFSKAIGFRGDLSKTVIYFFSPDKTFERVRRNPQKYVNFFRRTAGIIGFDYSIHSDMPIIKQKSQMNDNLSLTYYFGNNGIGIYPSPRCGSDELEDEYLSAFPHGSTIALGVHGFIKKKYQQHEWRHWIKKVIEVLEPKTLIIVGHLTKELVGEFSTLVNIVVYDSFIEERCKEVKRNGNQRRKL